jgi:hypothetical protein
MFRCKKCGRGFIEIDTDSFVSQVEADENDVMVLSVEVKGYCLNCSAEHTFNTQGYAEVEVEGEQ